MFIRRAALVTLTIWSALAAQAAQSQTLPPQALAEINYLQNTFGVSVNWYPLTPGNYSLAANQSFTAAQLSNEPLQSSPPQLGTLPAYPGSQSDGNVGF
jgi:hypothetical protein